MADSKKLVPFILSWETDKYTNNKNDREIGRAHV